MSNTIRDGVRYFGCCLCDNIFEGYGNNPDPVKDKRWKLIEGEDFKEDDECCIDCNNTKVIPARMKEMGL
jgi:hypothetical protein